MNKNPWKPISSAPIGERCIVARGHTMAAAIRYKDDDGWFYPHPSNDDSKAIHGIDFVPTHWSDRAHMEPTP